MRWLGLDPGEKRTGVAVSSPEGTYAIPVCVLRHRAGGPTVDDILKLVEEYRPGGLVIGLPLSMSGRPSEQTNAAVEFARGVALHFSVTLEMPPGARELCTAEERGTGCDRAGRTAEHLRIVLWDERLSSWEAERLTEVEETDRKKRYGKKPAIDAHAAAVILQSFLDSLAREDRGKRPTTD